MLNNFYFINVFDEFIKNYNLMVKESEEIVQNMKRRLVINN